MAVKDPKGCIYHSVNLKNQKGYVGQHKNVLTVEARWVGHVREAHKGSRLCFHSALRKNDYEKGFSWEVVWCGPVRLLNKMEAYYIKKLHTFVNDPKGGGYNLTTGGDHFEFADEVLARMSAAAICRMLDPLERERLRTAGKSAWAKPENRVLLLSALRTPVAVANRNKAHRANWDDPKYSSKMRKAMNSPEACEKRGVKRKALWADPAHHAYMLTTIRAPEVHAKISAASSKPENVKARKKGLNKLEVRAKMKNARLAEWSDPAHHAAMLVKHNSPETRAKHAEASSAAWQNPKHRKTMLAIMRTPAARAIRSAVASKPENIAKRKASRQTDQCRSKMAESARARWADPVERKRLLTIRAEARERKLASA